jgi:lysozyme
MTAGPDAYTIIKHFESLCLVAYLCPAGVPTIGWGHTGGVSLGQKITPERAEQLIQADVLEFASMVTRHVAQPLTQQQFDALVSFVFNEGPGRKGVKDGFVVLKSGEPSTMLRNLNAGKYADASAELDGWNKGGGKVLPGLVKRRAAERALFDGKDYRKWLT